MRSSNNDFSNHRRHERSSCQLRVLDPRELLPQLAGPARWEFPKCWPIPTLSMRLPPTWVHCHQKKGAWFWKICRKSDINHGFYRVSTPRFLGGSNKLGPSNPWWPGDIGAPATGAQGFLGSSWFHIYWCLYMYVYIIHWSIYTYIVWYYTLLCYIIWYFIILYYVILYYIML